MVAEGAAAVGEPRALGTSDSRPAFWVRRLLLAGALLLGAWILLAVASEPARTASSYPARTSSFGATA